MEEKEEEADFTPSQQLNNYTTRYSKGLLCVEDI